ncbi:hypothetical protein COO59_06225 [Mixta theicola]|uniref:Uncharacterized protein n=1 Tax=Mixta theicola TaxID=1458355 RepID=A0A2K1QCF0_9GAMM|nr:hypothetical protein COO59_06225 [Mixta theicola]
MLIYGVGTFMAFSGNGNYRNKGDVIPSSFNSFCAAIRPARKSARRLIAMKTAQRQLTAPYNVKTSYVRYGR